MALMMSYDDDDDDDERKDTHTHSELYFYHHYHYGRNLKFFFIFADSIQFHFWIGSLLSHSMFTSIANTNMNSSKRTMIFILVATLSLPPQFTIVDNYPWKIVHNVLMTDISYLLAGLIYSLKYPERLFPGHCDLFSSHAIFHIIIIIAGIGSMHSLSMISFYQINMTKLY